MATNKRKKRQGQRRKNQNRFGSKVKSSWRTFTKSSVGQNIGKLTLIGAGTFLGTSAARKFVGR